MKFGKTEEEKFRARMGEVLGTPSVEARYAFLPRRMVDGVWVWLEHYHVVNFIIFDFDGPRIQTLETKFHTLNDVEKSSEYKVALKKAKFIWYLYMEHATLADYRKGYNTKKS